MREGIGGIMLYNMIILFILVVFALLAGALSYYKAFKVNSYILSSIDKYEGYNSAAVEEIDRDLNVLGYIKDSASACPERDGKQAEDYPGTGNNPYYYCVYFYGNDVGENSSRKSNADGNPIYYNYSVVSYIYVDLPIVGNFRVPVHTKGERIYNFSDDQSY